MIRATLICLLMCPALLRAQFVTGSRPEVPQYRYPIILGRTRSGISLPHNRPETIRAEILDETQFRKIGRSSGIPDADLDKIGMRDLPDLDTVELLQSGESSKTLRPMIENLQEYVRAREDGHTKECLLAGLTNRLDRAYTEHQSLRAIVDRHRFVPISRIKLHDTRTETIKFEQMVRETKESGKVDEEGGENKREGRWVMTQEVRKWESYLHVDGDICWTYYLEFKPDGSLDYMVDAKRDAKDFDPKYKVVFEEVDKAVAEEMKKEGTAGNFGSCHRAWELKKEKLHEKGIDWLTPTELDPNAIYD